MKAALYARISSDRQLENFSITAQIKALKEYCIKNSIEIFNIYIDEAEKGSNENRPMFQQMIKESSLFDIVLVHKFDRFARKVELSRKVKRILKENKVNVISITQKIEDSPLGFFQEGILELMSEYYIRNLSEEVLKGHIERANQGLHSGPVPFGYDSKDKKMIINQDESKIVKIIFDMFLSGKGCTLIAQYLDKNRILTKQNKRFGFYQVNRMLKNIKYIGKIEYRGKIYQGKHEAIITEKQFEEVQKELKRRNKNPNTGHSERRSWSWYKYYLTGILYCGHCKGNLRIIRSGNKWVAYSCGRAARYTNLCNVTKSYKAKQFETEIEEILYDFMQGKIEINTFISKDVNKNDILLKRLNKIPIEIERAKQAYISQAFSLTEYKEIKIKLENEIEEIRFELNNYEKEIIDNNKLQKNISSVWDNFKKEADVCKKREIILTIIDKIYIYKDGQVDIHFRDNF